MQIEGIAFSVERLRQDADEIGACGGFNEAACMRWAAGEIERLRAKLKQVQDEQCGACGAKDDFGLAEFFTSHPDRRQDEVAVKDGV